MDLAADSLRCESIDRVLSLRLIKLISAPNNINRGGGEESPAGETADRVLSLRVINFPNAAYNVDHSRTHISLSGAANMRHLNLFI